MVCDCGISCSYSLAFLSFFLPNTGVTTNLDDVTWTTYANFCALMPRKVRKRAKIRNRYKQAPHLTQDTNGKVTTSQLHITNESQEVSQQVTTRHQQTDVHESITKQDRNNINDPQKEHRLGTVNKNVLLEGINRFNGAPFMEFEPNKLSGCFNVQNLFDSLFNIQITA